MILLNLLSSSLNSPSSLSFSYAGCSNHLCSLPLHSLLSMSLCTGDLGLDTALQTCSHWCSVEGNDQPSWPADNVLLNAPQDAVGLLCCWSTLLAHGQFVHQHPQVLLRKAAFQAVGPQHVLVHGVINPQGQDFAFPFAFCKVPVVSVLQPVKFPLVNQPLPSVLYHLPTCWTCALFNHTGH